MTKSDEQSRYESELLERLRIKLRDTKDDLDIISWAIRSLEKTLEVEDDSNN